MTLDEVPSQAGISAQGPLEVDEISALEPAKRRHVRGFGSHIRLDDTRRPTDHRQADPIHRHAVAWLHASSKFGRDEQAEPGSSRRMTGDLSDRLNKSCEHTLPVNRPARATARACR